MRATLQLRRKSDLDRIKRLFTPDDAEFERLALIAAIEFETRLFAGARLTEGP